MIAVVALSWVSMAPAEAATSPWSKPDAYRDATNGTPGGGDIILMKVVNKASSVVLVFQTRRALDPFTNPQWNTGGATRARWWIDTDNSQTPDYYVQLGDQFAPTLVNASNSSIVECAVVSSFSSPNYRVEVPKSCIGDPFKIRARLELVFGTNLSADFAPGPFVSSFSPQVRPTS